MAHDEAVARSILTAISLGSATLSPLARGLSSDAWLVRWPKGDAVLRIATYADEPVTYPNEHAVMRRLRAAGATVPAPITGSWQLDGWDGPAFSLTTFLPGTNLLTDARVWAYEPIAAFLRLLHALDVEGAGPVVEVDGRLRGAVDDPTLGTIDAWSGAPLWPLDGSTLDDHPALGERPRLVARLEAHRDDVRVALLRRPFVLVHSDLHEENILQDGRSLGFIDLGVAFVGAPTWEFAAVAYFLDWDLADRTLREYLDPPADLDDWRRATALTALSLGPRRWHQDRQNGLDEDAHNEAYLLEALARLTR
jgi:Ser/Thr protein kinase RdoA (MazF antagonist)